MRQLWLSAVALLFSTGVALAQVPNFGVVPNSVGGSGGSSTLTANSSATSGFAANNLVYSDGSKVQALALGTGVFTALGNPAGGTGGFALQSGLGSYCALAGAGACNLTGFENITIGALAATTTPAASLINSTASTSGATVQVSPSLLLEGHAWNTTATAADNCADWQINNTPVSGATPSTNLIFGSRVGVTCTGAFTPQAILGASFAGELDLYSSFTSSSVNNYLSISTQGGTDYIIEPFVNGAGGGKNLSFRSLSGAMNLDSTAVRIRDPNNAFSNTATFNGGVAPSLYINAILGFSAPGSGLAVDTFLDRDGPDILARREGTSPGTIRSYSSFTDANNGSWAGFSAAQTGTTEACAANTVCIGTYGNGTGASTLSKLRFDVLGSDALDYNLTSTGAWNMGAHGLFAGAFASNSIDNGDATNTLFSFASGSASATFSPAATSPLFRFAGTTSSFPALKRSTTLLQARLADDSADTQMEMAGLNIPVVGSTPTVPSGQMQLYAMRGTSGAGFCTAFLGTASTPAQVLEANVPGTGC